MLYQQRSSRSLVLLGKIHIINTGFPKDWGFQHVSTILVSFFPSISAKSGRLAVSTSRRERTNPTRDQFQTRDQLWRNWGCSQHLVNLVPRNCLEPWKQHETPRYKYCWGRLDLHHNEPRVFSRNPWSNCRGPSWQVFGGYLQVYNDYRIHGAGIYANMTGVYWW